MEEKELSIEIMTPDQSLYMGKAKAAFFPAIDGYLGVLPGHAPLVTRLGRGVITLKLTDGESRKFFCNGGFAEIVGQELSLMADVAEDERQIDISRAEKSRDRAQNRLRSGDPDIDYQRVVASLMRSLDRLRTSGH